MYKNSIWSCSECRRVAKTMSFDHNQQRLWQTVKHYPYELIFWATHTTTCLDACLADPTEKHKKQRDGKDQESWEFFCFVHDYCQRKPYKEQ